MLGNSASSAAHELAEKLRSEAVAFDAGEREAAANRRSDDALLAHLKSFFGGLGITRLSRITGLDTIGIPVWAVTRPNASTLSVSQGKGRTDTHAAISAIMECLELAISEDRHPRAFVASLKDLPAQPLPLQRYVRPSAVMPASDERLSWVGGLELMTRTGVSVPEELVRLDDQLYAASPHPFWQASDGNGAGKTLTEAILQGLFECVERDALALASFRTPAEVLASEIAPVSLMSEDLDWAVTKIASAGLTLRLFDITSNLEIPCFLALIAPARACLKYIDLASGTGAHRHAARAAFRAVVEAVQTRLTTIAGARDDFDPAEFKRHLPKDLEVYLQPPKSILGTGRALAYQPSGRRHPADDLTWSLSCLSKAGIASAMVVSFETERAYGVSCVKVLVPELESDPQSKNRRLGRRALAAMLGAR